MAVALRKREPGQGELDPNEAACNAVRAIAEREQLEDEIAELKAEQETARRAIRNLSEENSPLKQQLERYYEENDRLKQRLERHYEMVSEENDRLKQRLERHYEMVSEENDCLKQRLERHHEIQLAEERKQNTERVRQLADEIAKLKAELEIARQEKRSMNEILRMLEDAEVRRQNTEREQNRQGFGWFLARAAVVGLVCLVGVGLALYPGLRTKLRAALSYRYVSTCTYRSINMRVTSEFPMEQLAILSSTFQQIGDVFKYFWQAEF